MNKTTKKKLKKLVELDKKIAQLKTLNNFTDYCKKHPTERFWQALRNFSRADMILYQRGMTEVDTFEWENREEFNKTMEEQ